MSDSSPPAQPPLSSGRARRHSTPGATLTRDESQRLFVAVRERMDDLELTIAQAFPAEPRPDDLAREPRAKTDRYYRLRDGRVQRRWLPALDDALRWPRGTCAAIAAGSTMKDVAVQAASRPPARTPDAASFRVADLRREAVVPLPPGGEATLADVSEVLTRARAMAARLAPEDRAVLVGVINWWLYEFDELAGY